MTTKTVPYEWLIKAKPYVPGSEGYESAVVRTANKFIDSAARLDVSENVTRRAAEVNQLLHDAIVLAGGSRSSVARVVSSAENGWLTGASQLCECAATSASQLEALAKHIRAYSRPARPAPRLKDVVADIRALHEEFDDLEVNLAAKTISATTAGVTLHGEYFGRFKITLDLDELGVGKTLKSVSIDPLDPNFTPARSDCCHPHVDGGVLCFGEGSTAAHAALVECRAFDLFVVVRQILKTYNADSAYVRLEDWHEDEDSHTVSCDECGYEVDEEEGNSCSRCGRELCDDCSTRCASCEEMFCSRHTMRDEVAEEQLCAQCSTTCDRCSRVTRDDAAETRGDLALCSFCAQAYDEEHPEEHVADEAETLAEVPPITDAETVRNIALRTAEAARIADDEEDEEEGEDEEEEDEEEEDDSIDEDEDGGESNEPITAQVQDTTTNDRQPQHRDPAGTAARVPSVTPGEDLPAGADTRGDSPGWQQFYRELAAQRRDPDANAELDDAARRRHADRVSFHERLDDIALTLDPLGGAGDGETADPALEHFAGFLPPRARPAADAAPAAAGGGGPSPRPAVAVGLLRQA